MENMVCFSDIHLFTKRCFQVGSADMWQNHQDLISLGKKGKDMEVRTVISSVIFSSNNNKVIIHTISLLPPPELLMSILQDFDITLANATILYTF